MLFLLTLSLSKATAKIQTKIGLAKKVVVTHKTAKKLQFNVYRQSS